VPLRSWTVMVSRSLRCPLRSVTTRVDSSAQSLSESARGTCQTIHSRWPPPSTDSRPIVMSRPALPPRHRPLCLSPAVPGGLPGWGVFTGPRSHDPPSCPAGRGAPGAPTSSVVAHRSKARGNGSMLCGCACRSWDHAITTALAACRVMVSDRAGRARGGDAGRGRDRDAVDPDPTLGCRSER